MTDRELVAELKAGEAAALATLYEREGGMLLRLATGLLGDRTDAEDLVHDLFVALPRLLVGYEHRDRLDAWLRGVAVRAALKRLRRDKRRREIIEANEPMQHASAVTDPWSGIDVERAVAKLSPGERAVVVLRQFEDLSHESIAGLLGISPGAVRVRYMRALDHLRALLEPKS